MHDPTVNFLLISGSIWDQINSTVSADKPVLWAMFSIEEWWFFMSYYPAKVDVLEKIDRDL